MHPSAAIVLAAALGVAPPDHPAGVSDGFTAIEAVTTDPQAFVQDWAKPGAHADLHVSSTARQGQPITVFVLFKGCRVDPQGLCHVGAKLQVVGPDPNPSPMTASFTVWDGPPLVPPLFARSQQAPTFTLDRSSPPGRYLLKIEVTDRTRNGSPVVMQLQSSITLAAAPDH